MRKLGLFILFLSQIVAHAYVSSDLLEAVEKKYDQYAKNRFIFLNETLKKLKNKSDLEKLNGVNNFYNKTPYMSDINNYKKKDYWATPWEFLGRDKGDCEDYVIAKYFALRHLGIESKKLYFTYVKSLKFNEPHMVLTYFKTPKSIPLVLDNYNYKIFPANERMDLFPIYNFNGESLYLAKRRGEQGRKITKNKKVHKKWDILIYNIERNKL